MNRVTKLLALSVVLLALAGIIISTDEEIEKIPAQRFDTAEMLRGSDAENFSQVTHPREFIFPDDYGSHKDYRTEWWYFTGNFEDTTDRKFGYQLTFFRFSPGKQLASDSSNWRNNQFYMAHFALSDIKEDRFYKFERLSRAAAGLAGAKSTGLHVWLDDWSVIEKSEEGFPLQIKAKAKEITIDLNLGQGKPVVLHGDQGVSIKNAEPGNASYYYSYTRMPSTGSIGINGKMFEVSGYSWMDREWSSSALGKDQVGWDWFSLQLSNNYELMFYRFRRTDNAPDKFSYGALVAPDGQIHKLRYDMVELEVEKHWRSQTSGVNYPSAWRLRVPGLKLDLGIRPNISNQELNLSFLYWEGSVDVRGKHASKDILGQGYVELTGYEK